MVMKLELPFEPSWFSRSIYIGKGTRLSILLLEIIQYYIIATILIFHIVLLVCDQHLEVLILH